MKNIFINRLIKKLRRDGLLSTLKSACLILNHRLFYADWDFDIIPTLLERNLKQRQRICIMQIGANTGNTTSDPLYSFIVQHCSPNSGQKSGTCTAILVEPVKHLFDQLSENYSHCEGVKCENIAIAEQICSKDFYRIRHGIDLAAHGLPPFAEQLGSFIPEQMESLWAHDPDNYELRRFVEENLVIDEVQCLPIRELALKHDLATIDFLQIDTEGYDYEVIKTIDFKTTLPTYINYERIHLKKDEHKCRALLTSRGYRLHDHGQDTLCTLTEWLSPFIKIREFIYRQWLKVIY